MATKLSLVSAALTEIGLSQYVFDISPDRLQDLLTRMNRMAAMWDGMFLRLGYSMGTDIDAEAGIPDTAEECFVLQLALRAAPTFGKACSLETRINAKNALNAMLTANAKRPEAPYPSNLPVGTGNRVGVTGQQYFPDTTEIPGLNDGATEY